MARYLALITLVHGQYFITVDGPLGAATPNASIRPRKLPSESTSPTIDEKSTTLRFEHTLLPHQTAPCAAPDAMAGWASALEAQMAVRMKRLAHPLPA